MALFNSYVKWIFFQMETCARIDHFHILIQHIKVSLSAMSVCEVCVCKSQAPDARGAMMDGYL